MSCWWMLRYLDHSQAHTDPQDDPDVCDEPTLHAGGTTLQANGSRASRRPKSSKTNLNPTPKHVIYRVVDGPIELRSHTEAAVGDVSGGDGDVLTGAGEEQCGAVEEEHVPVPVLTASPATTLHLQEAGAKTRLYTPQNASSDLLLSALIVRHQQFCQSRLAPPGGDLRYNLTLFRT